MAMYDKKSVEDLNVAGKRVIVRVDFNVPLDKETGTKITDDKRIKGALPTIQYLVDNGAKVILVSHLGRPKNGPEAKFSMKPAADRLAELIGKPVILANDVIGEDAKAKAAALKDGEILMLCSELRIVLCLFLVETDVLEHEDLAVLESSSLSLCIFADNVSCECNGLADELSESVCSGLHGELSLRTVLRTSEVGNEDNLRIVVYKILALMYRVITFGYGMMMDKMNMFDDPKANLIAVMIMMIMLNAMVYGGGKTILEFNRPYIFMIPEKASKKLMACIAASLPEMLFDSIVSGALAMYFGRMTIIEGISVVVMMMVFDLLFQLVGLMSLRIFKSLGRMLLVTVRSFIGYGFVLAAFIPGIVVYFLLHGTSLAVIFFSASAFGAILAGILMIFAKDLVDKVELA